MLYTLLLYFTLAKARWYDLFTREGENLVR